jgi:hypothetical protein
MLYQRPLPQDCPPTSPPDDAREQPPIPEPVCALQMSLEGEPPSPSPLCRMTTSLIKRLPRIPKYTSPMNTAPSHSPSLPTEASCAMPQTTNISLPFEDLDDPPLSSTPHHSTDASMPRNQGTANEDSMNFDNSENTDLPPPTHRNLFGLLMHYQPPAATFLHQTPLTSHPPPQTT